MSLQIYNTMSQKKVPFEPLKKGEVSMYVCGPTVYSYIHIGNFRPIIFFNVVANWLEHLGYKVTYALNYTDIDDKIIESSKKEGLTCEELTQKYIAAFEEDFSKLKLRPHNYNPKVTDHLPQIISLIEKLIKNEKAYVNSTGDVLYSVKSLKDYGKLSHKNLDDLEMGSRVEVDETKRDPSDFVLWKQAKPGEPKWASPWGDGRPGWHIECSAMAMHLLGETIDLHGGGIDLIFPHHENEIAQSEGATGKTYVRYWMHNNFINMGAVKMSKSLGNVLTGHAFISKYNSEILKYMILSSHYRKPLDFSQNQIDLAISGLARIYSAMARAEMIKGHHPTSSPHKDGDQKLQEHQGRVRSAFNDDFNTAEVLAHIFDTVRYFNQVAGPDQKISSEVVGLCHSFIKWMRENGKILALFQEPATAFLIVLDDMLLQQKGLERSQIDELVAKRSAARKDRDFARADEIRNDLLKQGIEIRDTPKGTTWEVQK